MIDLKTVNQTFKGCGFKHAIIKKPETRNKPKEDNINAVMKCIKIHGQITQAEITKRIALSHPTIASCIKLLLEQGEIKKNFAKSNAAFADRTFSATESARLVY